MLNYIWFGMIFISVIVGTITGNIDAVTQAAIDMSKTAVDIAISLIGIMALWLGIMKIAEQSGLIKIIAKGLRPITLKLFPEVPPDHPAIGSIILNMAANILGLGNAATPLGLKAMEELQELNENKEIATNAMCTFLAINTSSVQIILPATVVALMGATANQIFITTILATGFSTMVAIISVKFFEKMKEFSYPKKERIMIDSFVIFTNQISRYIIPFLLVSIPFYGLFIKKIKVYELCVEGAKDGVTIAVRIIPYLVAILVAIGMFRASGALNILLIWLTPFLNFVGFPPENLPLALMRPLSGSGSLGLLTDLIDQHGQDSLISKIGATMYGSTETTFYVLAVYFGSVGIKKSRHALISGLLADLAGIIAAVFLCQILFGDSTISQGNHKKQMTYFQGLKK